MKTPYRTILLSAFALTSILTPISASDDGLRLGVRAGAAKSRFYTETIPLPYYHEMGTGLGIGLVLKYPLTEQLSVHAEASLYIRDLSYITCLYDPVTGEPAFGKRWMEEIVSVPITLQFAPIKRVPLCVSAGVQFDIPFGTEEDHWVGSSSNNKRIDRESERSALDVGIAAGVSYMLIPSLGVDFRYAINLNRPFDESLMGSKSSLMAFGAGLTYYFLRL